MAAKLRFMFAVSQVVGKNTLICRFLEVMCTNIGYAYAMKNRSLYVGFLLAAQFVRVEENSGPTYVTGTWFKGCSARFSA
jgi:hypothetical protein